MRICGALLMSFKSLIIMNTRVLTGRLRSTGLDAYLINLNDFPSTDRSRQRQAQVVGSSLNASRVAGVLPVVYAAPPPTPHKVRVYLRCPPGTCVTCGYGGWRGKIYACAIVGSLYPATCSATILQVFLLSLSLTLTHARTCTHTTDCGLTVCKM